VNSQDDLERQWRSEGDEAEIAALSSPRVVILDDEDEPKVEILELPDDASLGALFCHRGTRWQVMGTRTGDRVLIARPAEA